jgi:hypothetical protein
MREFANGKDNANGGIDAGIGGVWTSFRPEIG